MFDWKKKHCKEKANTLFVSAYLTFEWTLLFAKGAQLLAKPELAYGLAKGDQTDSQVGSQVAKNRKFHAYHWLMRFYNNRLLAIKLCRLALGGQTVKNFRPNLSSNKVNASRRKSTQVGGQTKHKWEASPKLASTCETICSGLNITNPSPTQNTKRVGTVFQTACTRRHSFKNPEGSHVMAEG